MQIKRFEAKNMTEALRQIKKELGPEAVILSARSKKRESGIFGVLKNYGVEITAATDNSPYQQREKSRFVQRDSSNTDKQGIDLTVPGYRDDEKIISSLNRRLLFQDVNEDIAYKLTEELKKIFFSRGMVDENMMTELLTSTIEGMGVKIRPMKLNPGTRKVIALIGSSGVGKTTTAAKIAAAWKFQNKKEVALIKLDDQRIGSLDQIKIYAKIIGIPLIFVSDKKELKEAIHKLKHKDLVIIDTPGLNCNSDREIEKVYGYFANMKMVQTQLLLNATTKEKDFIHIAEKLNTLGIKRLIFTKIDESRTYGNILNHLVRTKIPVSYFSFGHEIPEGIEDASMERLLRLLLKGERADTRERDVLGDREIMTSRENRQKFTKNYFVANQNSDVFHKPGCKWTRMIKEDNVVVFKDVSEAEAKRFKPCRYCTPKTEIKYDRPNYKIRQRRIAV